MTCLPKKANIYLFKVNIRNTKKTLKFVQSQQQKHQNDVTQFPLKLSENLWLTFISGNTFIGT